MLAFSRIAGEVRKPWKVSNRVHMAIMMTGTNFSVYEHSYLCLGAITRMDLAGPKTLNRKAPIATVP